MIRKSFFAVLSFILLFSVVVMQVQAEQLEPKEVKSPAGQKLSGIVSISANSFRANDVSSNDYNLFAWIKGNKFGGGVINPLPNSTPFMI
ncbi:MAG TPA: hypothetical protein DIT25_02035 [Candidatus Moranbacteria bacterium]|nr:hypothetical protein [Candidatus Moranbacteria bacterium]